MCAWQGEAGLRLLLEGEFKRGLQLPPSDTGKICLRWFDRELMRRCANDLSYLMITTFVFYEWEIGLEVCLENHLSY